METTIDGVIIGSIFQAIYPAPSSNQAQIKINCTVEINTLNGVRAGGDVVVSGISLVNHTHSQNSVNYFAGGATTNPPS